MSMTELDEVADATAAAEDRQRGSRSGDTGKGETGDGGPPAPVDPRHEDGGNRLLGLVEHKSDDEISDWI